MAKPAIYYFPIRGRAEPAKLAYAYKGVEFDVINVDYQQMKTDLDAYPFGQCPRLVDGDIDVSQSNTLLRLIARKYGLYGNSIKDAAMIDMVMDGVESIKQKYLSLIYVDNLAGKDEYASTHIDPSTATGQRNGGAHFFYLAKLLEKAGGSYLVGSEPSIADITFWELLDTHMRVYEEQFKADYPALVAYHAKVAALPSIKAYLEGPLRLAQVNNNNLG